MPDDLARVIARILDGIKAPPSPVRGRTLQLFSGQVEQTTVSDTVTTGTSTAGGPRYGIGKYGLVIYGE